MSKKRIPERIPEQTPAGYVSDGKGGSVPHYTLQGLTDDVVKVARPKFINTINDKAISDGDVFAIVIDGTTYIALIERDADAPRTPDKWIDGFWPSEDPNDDGWIGDNPKVPFDVSMQRAGLIHRRFERGDSFYVGVCVYATRSGVELTGKYRHAMWRIEANYPEWFEGPVGANPARGWHYNHDYLVTVANELLDECIEHAERRLAEIKAGDSNEGNARAEEQGKVVQAELTRLREAALKGANV